jgi:hypothetical protein
MLGHLREILCEVTPAAHISETQINDGSKAEDNHKKLQYLSINGRSQATLEDVNEHNRGANPEADCIGPAQQLM